MKQDNLEKISNKLVTAFLKNRLIKAIPNKYTKKIKEAQKLRKRERVERLDERLFRPRFHLNLFQTRFGVHFELDSSVSHSFRSF